MFDSITFSKYTSKDILEYAEFKREFLKDIWSETYKNHFVNSFKLLNQQYILLAKKGKTIVGQLFVTFKSSVAYIEELEVSHQFQNKGIGKQLIKIFRETFKEIPLELIVNKENKTAIKFYEQLGFDCIKENKDTYKLYLAIFENIEA